MAKHLFHLLLTLILLSGIVGAESDHSSGSFIGKWKLDPAHSRLIDQMRVEAAGPNKYNLIFSGDNVETVVADGTDQPGLFGSTLAIVAEDARNWKVVRKTNGRITIIGRWQLSPDGKRLTDNYTGYRDGAATSSLRYIYERIAESGPEGGTSGFVGTWESVTEDVNSAHEMEIRGYHDDGLSFFNKAAQVTQNIRFDGKDYPGSGPDVPLGYASAGRRISDKSIERIDKVNGKVLYSNEMQISTDGRILTMTVHVPGREKPDVMVFDRQ